MRRTITVVTLVSALLLGSAGTLYSRQSLKWERVYLTSQVVDDTVYLPGPLALRMASLGYAPFAADMVFVRTHAYYLRHFASDRIFDWLDPYVDAVITLDPDNREVYYWASHVVRYGQIIDENVIKRSNAYAERGIERFPDDARLYAHLGFNEFFEMKRFYDEKMAHLEEKLGKATAEQRQEYLAEMATLRRERYEQKKRALINYTISAMLPNTTIDPLFLVTLYIQQDLFEAAGQLIQGLYWDTSREDRKTLLVRLESLGKKKEADTLREIEKRHRKEMPFINESLFALVDMKEEYRVPDQWDEVGRVYDDVLKALEKQWTSEDGR